MLPLEVVGLMVTLLSLVIVSPPGPIQLIINELDSTPLTVLTVHWIIWELPTIAPCMGLDGDMVTVGGETMENKITHESDREHQGLGLLTLKSHPKISIIFTL